MATAEPRPGIAPGPRLLRRPGDRTAPVRWVHHAADLNTGQVRTVPSDEAPTQAARAERLVQLGRPVDGTIFTGPSYRLTTRNVYQTSPEAWLLGVAIDFFSPPEGGIQWTPGPNYPSSPTDYKGMSFYFSQLPPDTSLVSIKLEGGPGSVSVGYRPLTDAESGPVSGQVSLQLLEGNYLDILYTPAPGTDPPEFVMTIEAGVQWLQFDEVTLHTAPPPVNP